jgi:hypothetical protein
LVNPGKLNVPVFVAGSYAFAIAVTETAVFVVRFVSVRSSGPKLAPTFPENW